MNYEFLTPERLLEIKRCISAIKRKKGKRIKYLHIDGLDYAIYETEKDTEKYTITVSEKSNLLHRDLAVPIADLYQRICDLIELKVRYVWN